MSYIDDPTPEKSFENIFRRYNFTHTDAEGLEDGSLAEFQTNVTFLGLPINRMTSHLFEDLKTDR